MLTKKQINKIADALNEKINIPKVPEKWEKPIFRKGLKVIDKALDKKLPEEVKSILADATDGITDAEAEIVKEAVLKEVQKKTDDLPPFLDKIADEFAVKAIDEIMKYLKKGAAFIN